MSEIETWNKCTEAVLNRQGRAGKPFVFVSGATLSKVQECYCASMSVKKSRGRSNNK